MKSVNHRYLDINIRMPKTMLSLEEKIRNIISKRLNRGKVDVFINYKNYSNASGKAVINMELAKDKNLVLFLSSTFLYRKETLSIIEKVQSAKCPLNYIYHIGQYLPDWHPWESYNSYFIGNPRTNGCREIMAIDLPWVVTAFGPIKSFSAIKSKNTELNISYNDNYLITLQHESGHKGVFAVDVVARKSGRNIEIFGEQLHLSWGGTADSLMEYDIEEKKDTAIVFDDASEHVEGYAAFVTENPYREELNSFLKQITDRSYAPAWDFERDKAVLDIIDKIEAE